MRRELGASLDFRPVPPELPVPGAAPRRGLPVPQVSTNGNLTLRFAVAVPGPILIGKDMHFGLGLFVPVG